MKRLFAKSLSFVLALCLLLARGIAGASTATGDVNGDGSTNSLDAAKVLKYDAALIELDGDAFVNADYNGDGAVDNLDAAYILRFDAGLEGIPEGAKTVDYIEDFTETRHDVCVSEAYENFYIEGDTLYYFHVYMSGHVIVHYTDGTEENVREALENGNLTVDMLSLYGVHFATKECTEYDSIDEFPMRTTSDDDFSPRYKYVLEGGIDISGSVQTTGFVNTTGGTAVTYENAADIARSEFAESFENSGTCVEYNEDYSEAERYVVRLYNDSYTEDYKIVYIDKNGKTLAIIHDNEGSKTVSHIEDVTETRHGVGVAEAVEDFYMDEENVYSFNVIKSPLVIVHYTDGSKDNVGAALRMGNITIDELRDMGVIFYTKSRSPEDRLSVLYTGTAYLDYYTPKYQYLIDGLAEISGTLQSEGFVNATGDTAVTYENADEVAREELTESFENSFTDIEYNEDGTEEVRFAVRFYNAKYYKDYKIVYIDKNGKTLAILHADNE